jgi:hypothetical protein
VLTCDSRWHCPLCAAKLTERDRVELQQAMVLWRNAGGVAYLLTFTFPHDVTMALEYGIEQMQEAQSRMKGWRGYKGIMEAAGAIGAVKALEVTYGANGWHPHVHMLVFAKPDQEGVLEQIRALWGKAVEKVGLGRINEHGFDVRGGDYAADYIAKFGKEPSDQFAHDGAGVVERISRTHQRSHQANATTQGRNSVHSAAVVPRRRRPGGRAVR